MIYNSIKNWVLVPSPFPSVCVCVCALQQLVDPYLQKRSSTRLQGEASGDSHCVPAHIIMDKDPLKSPKSFPSNEKGLCPLCFIIINDTRSLQERDTAIMWKTLDVWPLFQGLLPARYCWTMPRVCGKPRREVGLLHAICEYYPCVNTYQQITQNNEYDIVSLLNLALLFVPFLNFLP